MLSDEELATKLLTGEWVVCIRCNGVGKHFTYYPGTKTGCYVCGKSAAWPQVPEGYMLSYRIPAYLSIDANTR